MLKRHFLWFIYFIFVALAFIFKNPEPLFISQGPYPYGKIIVWGTLLMFLGYILHCHLQADFFETMKKTGKYHWTRQIGIDLYLGVVISGALIYLIEGSLIVLLFWLLPFIMFANLATLLYIAMNYDSLMAHFIK